MNQLEIYIWINAKSGKSGSPGVRKERRPDLLTFPTFRLFCGKFPYEKIQPHSFHIHSIFTGPGSSPGYAGR